MTKAAFKVFSFYVQSRLHVALACLEEVHTENLEVFKKRAHVEIEEVIRLSDILNGLIDPIKLEKSDLPPKPHLGPNT